jgi:hypothetical protein
VAFRDFLEHSYARVDPAIVWDVLEKDIPPLLARQSWRWNAAVQSGAQHHLDLLAQRAPKTFGVFPISGVAHSSMSYYRGMIVISFPGSVSHAGCGG